MTLSRPTQKRVCDPLTGRATQKWRTSGRIHKRMKLVLFFLHRHTSAFFLIISMLSQSSLPYFRREEEEEEEEGEKHGTTTNGGVSASGDAFI